MTTIYPLPLTCPVCNEDFESCEIGSCGFGSRRTDFRPNYWGLNPVLYFYHLCPSCGFCGTKASFKKTFENATFKEKILSLGPLHDHSLEKKLERAIICLEIMKRYDLIQMNEYDFANYWLDLFWWAETPELMKKSGQMVIKYFQIALEKNIVPSEEIFKIKYLIAEIYRRLDQKNIANKLFDEVISLTEKNDDLKWLHNLAIQQKTSPKDILDRKT